MKLSPEFFNAAQYTLDNFFSKPYDDNSVYEGNPFGDGGREAAFPGSKRRWIDRPIHGLVHTLRTVAYAPVLLACFKERYPDQFKHIDDTELQKIMIAQLFFVAGRRSEESARKYGEYHTLSANYFREYVRKNLLGHNKLFKTEQDMEKYARIVDDKDDVARNSPEGKIVGFAHGIDLMRTRLDTQYFQEHSEQEKEDARREGRRIYDGMAVTLRRMFGDENAVAIMNYAWQLIQATGDSCQPYNVAPNAQGAFDYIFPANALTFQKPPLLLDRKFEECQYSSSVCLQELAKIAPPKGVTFELPDQLRQKKASPKKEIDPAVRERIIQLKNQRRQAEEELGAMMLIKEALQEEPNNPDIIANEERLKKDLAYYEEELKKLESQHHGMDESQGKWHYGARSYQVRVENISCLDGVMRDEILIPGDNNCCYNAALVAAKHSGVALPAGISNHYELRQAVARRMELWYNQVHVNEPNLPAAAVEGYNREFGTRLRNFEEYINEVKRLDTWGGEFELQMMANILNLTIIVHSDYGNLIRINPDNGSQGELNLHHMGNHYNFYVEHGTWHDLAPNDPVIQFDLMVDDIRYAQLSQYKTKKIEINPAQYNNPKNPFTSLGVEMNYTNFIAYSDLYNKIQEKIKHYKEILIHNDSDEIKEKLRIFLGKVDVYKRNLAEFKKGFLSDPIRFQKFSLYRYSLLMKEYQNQINLVESANNNLQALQKKQLALILDKQDPKTLSEKIQQAKALQQSIKKTAQDIVIELDKEIEFLIRERTPDQYHDQMIVEHKGKKVLLDRRMREMEKTQSEYRKENSVGLTHLINFLGDKYKPELSLKENIKTFFNDHLVRSMLYTGGPLGGFEALGENARWIYEHPEADQWHDVQKFKKEGGKYDEQLLDHFCEQLSQMVMHEVDNSDRYVLYNAMSANLSVGNDVIREISALSSGKGYGAMFRLFSEGFDFEDAESFRKDVYENRKVMDGGAEFHSRGLCCGLSPFQALSNESPLDFWTHNRNVQTFDRWKYEIYPKLRDIINDEPTLTMLSQQYEELIDLSNQMGARMTQFFMYPDDLDTFAWASGGYGFKLPTVEKRLGRVFESEKLSDALSFYRQSPDEFIAEEIKKRNAALNAPENQDKFKDHSGKNHKGEVYDEDYNFPDAEKKNLAQLQARLYLHPSLFEDRRMEIYTYYALPINPKIKREYDEKLKKFTQNLFGLVIEAHRKNELKSQSVPKELLESFIYKAYNPELGQKYEVALNELKAFAGQIEMPPQEVKKSEVSPLYERLREVLSHSEEQVERFKNIRQLLADDAIKNNLSQCLYEAICIGDVDTFKTLIQYSRSGFYDFKTYPINLDELQFGDQKESAFILVANHYQPEIMEELLAIRKENFALLNALSKAKNIHLNLTRSQSEVSTKNTALHFLAQAGNVDGFIKIANSLSEARSYTSYLSAVALQVNARGENPLHILAFNSAELQEQRTQLLNHLCALEQNAQFDILFGKDAVTALNKNGLSPLMIAALTQNREGVRILAKKAGLSLNQKQMYLWIAEDPIVRIPQIQANLERWGHCPGFVPSGWIMPDNFKALPKASPNADIQRPYLVDEMKEILKNAFSTENNLANIKILYNELIAAQSLEEVTDYLSSLLKSYSENGNAIAVNNLSLLAKDLNLTFTHKTAENDTPLIAAIRKGNMAIAISLLKDKDSLGVQRTAKDAQGKTALHYLAERPDSSEAIVELMKISTWSESVPGGYGDPLRIQDNEGNNPVHLLARTGNLASLIKIDEEFQSKATYFYSAQGGLYNKLCTASQDYNRENKTAIMIAVLTHPNNEQLLTCFARAIGLSPADVQKYHNLSQAILARDAGRLQQVLVTMKGTAGWNEKALNIDARQILSQNPPPHRMPPPRR